MLTSPAELRAVQRVTDLETPLAAVEQRLAALGTALQRNDARAIESEANELHRALAAAIHHFSRAAREGDVPLALRRRLAMASGQVAAQREALARATAALDRAIDVLLPPQAGGVYAASGSAERGATGAGLLA
jgi:hypothetical protein